MIKSIPRYILYYLALFGIETVISVFLDQLVKFPFFSKDFAHLSDAFQIELAWISMRVIYMAGFHLALFVVFNLAIDSIKEILAKTIIINCSIYLILFGMYAVANPENERFFDPELGLFYYTFVATLLSPIVLRLFRFYPVKQETEHS